MLISWHGWPLPYSYMPAKGISVCPIPTLVEKRWVFVIFWMGKGHTLHYTSASRAKSSIFFSLGTQEWLVWHSQGLPDTFRVARYLPMVEMTRKRQEKGPFSGKKRKNGRNASKYWVPKNSFLWEYGNPKTFPFLEKNRVQVLMEASYEGLRAAGGVVRSI